MKKSILVLVVVSYVLSGCHNMKSSRSSMDPTDESGLSNNELDSDISNIELPIIETEYGRGASSDGKDTNANEEATRLLSDEEKSIIIFFSRSGNTQNLARMIRNEVGSDMLELQVTDPYPADYEKAVARATQERDVGEYPEIKTNIPSLSQYERIYLGYQTWGMTLSNPITSFLMENEKKLSGKAIYPFSTNAGYGEGDSVSRIKEIVPNATIAESFNIHDEELLANRGRVEGWIKTTL